MYSKVNEGLVKHMIVVKFTKRLLLLRYQNMMWTLPLKHTNYLVPWKSIPILTNGEPELN